MLKLNVLKIIIAGGRDFKDYPLLRNKCDYHLTEFLESGTHIEIVSGRARGADKLGEKYAKERGFPIKYFPADWETYGKGAGPVRNGWMADYADMLIAFWDMESTGTSNMISQATNKNLIIRVEYYV
jgi:hypothetical protein